MDVAVDVCPGFRIRQDQKGTINDIFQWCVMADGRYDPHKGLMLWGNNGTGKSTMLEIVKRFCRIVRPPTPGVGAYSFRITNATEVCGRFSTEGYPGIDTYITSRRQAFDELGSETSPTGYYGNAENVLQYILQRRYDNRFDNFTHVTTNLSPEKRNSDGRNDIIDRYGERIWDRCKEMFNFVPMKGATWRKI